MSGIRQIDSATANGDLRVAHVGFERHGCKIAHIFTAHCPRPSALHPHPDSNTELMFAPEVQPVAA